MSSSSINLSTDLTKYKSIQSGTEEIAGEQSSASRMQNMSVMSDVGSSLSTKKETEDSAMFSMQGIASAGKDMCNDVAKYSNNIASSLSNSPSLAAPLSACKSALSSVKDFGNKLNPMNGFASLLALAQFLSCPESTLQRDLTNAFNTVVRGASNTNPSNLLADALVNLTKIFLKDTPTVNNALNFFTVLSQYYKTDGADKAGSLNLINALLNNHNSSMSYLTNASLVSSIADLLDANNSLYNNMNVSIPLPTPNIKQYCSNLAKIINQMQANYRSDNIYDDVVTNRSALQNISDPSVARTIDSLTGASESEVSYSDNLKSATNLGYHGETAINSSLVAAIENTKYLTMMETEFTEAGDDPVKQETARINALAYTGYLSDLNNTTSTRLSAFSNGIDNIQRESNYYDVSDIIKRSTV